ncbi:thermonuclease family protein [Candidatus Sumerlaeota bacterium]|nr:thermonuclease family protein [Candidatus Sumerlaeota bacterium]
MTRGRQKSRGRSYSRKGSDAWKKVVLVGLLGTCGVLAASGVYYYSAPEDARAAVGKAAVIGQTLKEDVSGADAEPFTVGRVVQVLSLNEVLLESGGRKQRVRLLNISDGTSRSAKLSTVKLQERLQDAQVRLEPNVQEGFDSAGRRLGYLLVNGENFNIAMVREGMSAYDTSEGRSAKYDREFRLAEADAKARKLGIWAAK